MAGPGAIEYGDRPCERISRGHEPAGRFRKRYSGGSRLAIVLYFAGSLERVLGHTGINIINRIGGLVLAAKAVGSIYVGVIGLFPFLNH